MQLALAAPPVNRTPMAPTAAVFLRPEQHRGDSQTAPDPRRSWRRAGTVRRSVLLILILAQTLAGTAYMTGVLGYQGGLSADMVLLVPLLVLFAVLFAWVSAGFWTAMMGFLVLLRGGDEHGVVCKPGIEGDIDASARTAVIMPICNESVQRVFAGLRATYRSLARTADLERFDFFVLSDTSDPDTRVAETKAWLDLCRELDAFGRLFYRWRRHRIKTKAGNVGDFCRRWGGNYRYMVVLDADSVMSGDCLGTLVRLMEANPNAGIIQTAPRPVWP
jgi:membrane glycosyltransferase